MNRIEVLVVHAHADMRQTMAFLAAKVARNYKCKITVKQLSAADWMPGIVGVYGDATKQRRRLEEGLFRAFFNAARGSLLLAQKSAETRPTTLAKLKEKPKYIFHCSDKRPQHFSNAAEMHVELPPVARPATSSRHKEESNVNRVEPAGGQLEEVAAVTEKKDWRKMAMGAAVLSMLTALLYVLLQ